MDWLIWCEKITRILICTIWAYLLLLQFSSGWLFYWTLKVEFGKWWRQKSRNIKIKKWIMGIIATERFQSLNINLITRLGLWFINTKFRDFRAFVIWFMLQVIIFQYASINQTIRSRNSCSNPSRGSQGIYNCTSCCWVVEWEKDAKIINLTI